MPIAVANGAVEKRVEIIAEAEGFFLLLGRLFGGLLQPNVLACAGEHFVTTKEKGAAPFIACQNILLIAIPLTG
jgi:hypothetical protein